MKKLIEKLIFRGMYEQDLHIIEFCLFSALHFALFLTSGQSEIRRTNVGPSLGYYHLSHCLALLRKSLTLC